MWEMHNLYEGLRLREVRDEVLKVWEKWLVMESVNAECGRDRRRLVIRGTRDEW